MRHDRVRGLPRDALAHVAVHAHRVVRLLPETRVRGVSTGDLLEWTTATSLS